MEDDDEFGDLYTDVLRPFSSSLSSSRQTLSAHSSLHRPIDLNDAIKDEDDEILRVTSHRNLPPPSNQNSIEITSFSAPQVRVLGDAKSPIKGSIAEDRDLNFDIEDVNTEILEDSRPIIPGLMDGDSTKIEASSVVNGGGVGGGKGGGDWEEDEESESEDDLQIVLNDNSHPGGPMGIDREVGDDDDDDDEDGDPLVIIADNDGPNIAIEEQDWGGGEDGVAAAGGGAEGERKEGGEATGKGSAVVGPKIAYSNHGYHHHPFHSQFKYVRPGAALLPAAPTVAPGGTPGHVRPPMNMSTIPGRGRGDWRPVGIKGGPQKNFHPGFGGPAWGAGRGFGSGLEFMLPSHKTIFDVDIDGFEEKPWKYSGVDVSDYFNFGLNEESWKDYCKQLEQYRLETTMQSKIRVYESGRAEQEFDPDLPPELAAATRFHDAPVDNSNAGKSDNTQSDWTKGSARLRAQIPTGRAIQVETGCGERIPSIEGRAPRHRDSDAIIEIICQDSLDDSSTGDGVQDAANDEPQRDDFRGSDVAEDDMVETENEYAADFPQAYSDRKGRRTPHVNSARNMPEGDGVLPLHPEAPAPYRHAGSKVHPPSYPGRDFGTRHEERQTQGRSRDRSPHLTPGRSSQDKKFIDNMEEESTESMVGKHSLRVSSPITVQDARELSSEEKDDAEPLRAEGSSRLGRDEMSENEETTSDPPKDGNVHNSTRKQKVSSHVKQPALQQLDDDDDSKAARSSENSKARSGSSKDDKKWKDGVEEEVVQGGRSTRSGSIRRHLDENEQTFRRKDRDVRHEMDRNQVMKRGRGDSYPHRDLDPSLPHHLHMKHEGYDRRKERQNPDIAWQQRDEDPHSSKLRTEDRKREHGDEMVSRLRGKIRETERSNKDEHLQPRKQLANGSYRIHHDKDGSSQHRERDDSLKIRFEMVDDYHNKQRKDEEYLKRDYADKEEILHGHRENTSRRRRERDDQQRIRDNLDGYHPVRHKDEVWLQRERGERPREREDLYRLKQSNEENLPKRERDEGRASLRNGRGVDDKAWADHARGKDEYKVSDKDYQLKDAVRNSEPQKRRDRMEDESLSHHRVRDDVYARGNQFSIDERRSRQERSSTRINRTLDSSDNQRMHEKKHKENTRKNKESDGGDHGTLGPSRRNQEDQSGHSDEMIVKRSRAPGNGDNGILMQRNSSKRHKEDASSDDEQQDLRRGRSKLERWTSHKERDYNISKQSASLKFKETHRNSNGGSLEGSKPPNELPKKVETAEKHPKVETVEKHPKVETVEKHPVSEEKDVAEVENKDADMKPSEDQHLDTVEKLKKRSERFKLPMPGEKDVLAIKKMENEALPSVKPETPADSEIKPERPPRKRRWTSN
ncbi:FIP1[III]-LIKE PROTEIN [Salix viminalis]|uniref:FIP1[III]-LIKE PROTEIN n=1 Tax=Salix viminalis TaxID=40686 RepID=A0A9Q0NP70_SALVM|nr:FIP1[III]-LIKE PROTEIN [Salix viminalis]